MMKVSVIIPVYNAEAFLERTIQSILEQTYCNIEIILIDDGSTDCSPQICEAYASNYESVIVKHVANNGASSARNLGIDIATGEYIVFMDSDDTVDKYYIDKMMNFVEEYDLVITDYYRIEADGDKIKKESSDVISEILTGNIHNDYYFLKILAQSPWGKVYKKKIIDCYNIKFPCDMIVSEDQVFNYRYFECINGNYFFINEPLYHYWRYKQISTLSQMVNRESFYSYMKNLKMKYDYLSRNNVRRKDAIINKDISFIIEKFIMVIPLDKFAPIKDLNIQSTDGIEGLKDKMFFCFIKRGWFYCSYWRALIKWKPRELMASIKGVFCKI